MSGWTSRWLLVVTATVAVPFWWLLIAIDRSAAPAKPIHIAELRTLAGILPGQHPSGIGYTLLGTRKSVGDFLAAGIGLKRRPLAIVAWTLPVPGKQAIMIDPGIPPPEASVGHFANFDDSGANRLEAAAKHASLVLYTQGPELTATPRQQGQAPAPGSSRPVSYTSAQAVAPGVVVIPASTFAPDARLIFVQLANGHEFLFAGSIATYTENWALLRARSHLATALGPEQDRNETYAWLRTIRQLRSEAPDLKVVPGHDYIWLVKHLNNGAIGELPDPPAPARMAKAAPGG